MLSHHRYHPMLTLTLTTLGSVLIVLALVLLLKLGAHAEKALLPTSAPLAPIIASTEPSVDTIMQDSSKCQGITTVSAVECLALLDIFTKTQGVQWISKTHWLNFASGNAPCDWYGVTCSGGHITELGLARNQLSGTLPLALGDLRALTRLRLENNVLTGRIPPPICRLAQALTDGNLAYNGLFTLRHSVGNCLATIDPDWRATQTQSVTDLRVTQFATTGLELSWTPIPYTADGGYYEIATAATVDGPYQLHGHTTDKTVVSYTLDNLQPGRSYFIRVRTYTPSHADQSNELWSNSAETVGVTHATSGNVLVAAYFPADNDLASEISYVVERFRRGTAFNPNVQVVLLVDGAKNGDTRLLEIRSGQVTTTTVVQQQWNSNELDTAAPAVLSWFLTYARTTYPATVQIVSLMGHGLALASEVEWPTVASATDSTMDAIVASATVRQAQMTTAAMGELPLLPREWEATPSDITNNSYMSVIDIGQALMTATNNGADPFDLIYFDQCFQGNLDLLYEVYKSAKVFVASPNYAWLAAAYDKYLAGFTPSSTPEELATMIINRYEISLDPTHPNTIFWVRSSDIAAIADAVSTLGDALLAAHQAGQTDTIANAVRQSKYVDTTQCSRENLQLEPPDELIGLETFAKSLRTDFGPADPYGVVDAVNQLRISLERVHKLSRVGNPYLAPNQTWNYTDTVTVLAPLPRNAPADVAWRASLYRSDAPFTATWTIDPSQPVTVTTALAYVREGRWDEFLAAWFTDLAPTVGAWCNYIPPAQVLVEEADVLTLTATLSGAHQVIINWTPTDDISVTEYRIDQIDPYAISWQTNEAVPSDQTAAIVPDPAPGTHRFRVLARNGDGELVGQSNEVTIEAAPNAQLFLPLVTR